MQNALVHCRRNGESIRVYEFGLPETSGLTVPPSEQVLIDQAKSNLRRALSLPAMGGYRIKVYYP